MIPEKAIAILQNEIACIKRAENCDRDCGKCDLVLPPEDIIEALKIEICAIDRQIPSQNLNRKDHVC